MLRSCLCLVSSSILCLLLLAVPGHADQLLTTGDEFVVNTFTTGNQGLPEVAIAPSGDYMIVWESSNDHDGDGWGVFSQRFSAAGTALGDEVSVNSSTTDDQIRPTVAAGPDGEFLVVWQSWGQDGSAFGVYGQRYDAAGDPLGGEFQVNTFTNNDQEYPVAAIGSDGKFFIVWESDGQDQSFGGIYGQMFGADGTTLGGEFAIHETTLNEQNDPQVVAVDGGYVVAWESDGIDGSGEAVLFRLFDSDGNPVGGEVQANTSTVDDQEGPSVAALANGNFAVVWESFGQDGSGETAVARVFSASGAALGGELVLNQTLAGRQASPRVALDGTGGFVATWEGVGSGGDLEIWGRRFSASGAAVGDEFQVNTETMDDQDEPVIAGGNGRFLISWRSFGGHDGDAAGVFAQRYEIAMFADGFESGDAGAWTTFVP